MERYRYMLRTAPPETVTPERRRQVRSELSASTPAAERGTADDPPSLARTATRAEMREPGTMERTLGAYRGAGMGMGGMLAGSLLASVAGAFIGTSIASAFLDDDMAGADAAGAGDDPTGDDPSVDTGSDAAGTADPTMDPGTADTGIGDMGGDFDI